VQKVHHDEKKKQDQIFKKGQQIWLLELEFSQKIWKNAWKIENHIY
jgi:hypothetical protein